MILVSEYRVDDVYIYRGENAASTADFHQEPSIDLALPWKMQTHTCIVMENIYAEAQLLGTGRENARQELVLFVYQTF